MESFKLRKKNMWQLILDNFRSSELNMKVCSQAKNRILLVKVSSQKTFLLLTLTLAKFLVHFEWYTFSLYFVINWTLQLACELRPRLRTLISRDPAIVEVVGFFSLFSSFLSAVVVNHMVSLYCTIDPNTPEWFQQQQDSSLIP